MPTNAIQRQEIVRVLANQFHEIGFTLKRSLREEVPAAYVDQEIAPMIAELARTSIVIVIQALEKMEVPKDMILAEMTKTFKALFRD